MSNDTVCDECGGWLDPDGYCSFHQPSRTGNPVAVTNTQVSTPVVVKTPSVSGSTSHHKSDWSIFALIVAAIYFIAALSELGFRFGWLSVSGSMINLVMALQLITTIFLAVYSWRKESPIHLILWLLLFMMNLLVVLIY